MHWHCTLYTVHWHCTLYTVPGVNNALYTSQYQESIVSSFIGVLSRKGLKNVEIYVLTDRTKIAKCFFSNFLVGTTVSCFLLKFLRNIQIDIHPCTLPRLGTVHLAISPV